MERINNYFPENFTISSTAAIKVYNLSSPRSGEPVKNQFVVRIPTLNIIRFQSYKTTCLIYDYDTRVLTVFPEAFGYSVTTSKYSRAFLCDELNFSGSDVDELRKLAKSESFGRDCPLFVQL